MIVLISAFSRKLKHGRENPKNYPYFNEVIEGIKNIYPEAKFYQVKLSEEPKLEKVDEVLNDLTIPELKIILDKCETWLSIDNFFHHFAAYYGKMGIVIFTVSDPALFGHYINFNIYKDKKYFRENQFGLWEECPVIENPYIEPQKVVDVFVELINFKRRVKK